MWHKAIWKGHPMRLELTRVGLLVELANHYTTRGASRVALVSLSCRLLCSCSLYSVIIFRCFEFFAGMRNNNPITISCAHIAFISSEIFLLSPVLLNGKSGSKMEHFNRTRKNLFLTLEPFWLLDWNHPMRAVVSDWPLVLYLSIILIEPTVFFHAFNGSRFNLNARLHVNNRYHISVM